MGGGGGSPVAGAAGMRPNSRNPQAPLSAYIGCMVMTTLPHTLRSLKGTSWLL
jgi:hypothetical protein